MVLLSVQKKQQNYTPKQPRQMKSSQPIQHLFNSIQYIYQCTFVGTFSYVCWIVCFMQFIEISESAGKPGWIALVGLLHLVLNSYKMSMFYKHIFWSFFALAWNHWLVAKLINGGQTDKIWTFDFDIIIPKMVQQKKS